MDRLPGNSVNP